MGAIHVAGISVCCTALITGIILIVVSFSTLEPNEVGIEHNGVTLSLNEEELYTAGRHQLGVGHSFFKFPKTLQTTSISNVACRTSDGLDLDVDVQFNWRLDISLGNLLELLYDYGDIDQVNVLYNRIARNVVRDVTANNTAFDFFTNRTQISGVMEFRLNQELSSVHGSVDAFQLLDIAFPEQFESARIRQETATQEIEQATQELQKAQIAADIQIARAKQEASIIREQAAATAKTVLLSNTAALQAVQQRLAANAAAYASVKSSLGLTQEDLLSYIWLDLVREAATKGADITAALSAPSALAG